MVINEQELDVFTTKLSIVVTSNISYSYMIWVVSWIFILVIEPWLDITKRG